MAHNHQPTLPPKSRAFGLGSAIIGTAGLLAGLALATVVRTRQAERRNPPEGRFVTIGGIRVHYRDIGSGPPTLIFHGNGATTEEMTASGLVEELASSHRVIIPDRPGFGYTERPRFHRWTPEAQADLFLHFLNRLGIERALVIGHSLGAQVALSLAVLAPDRVAGLVLMSGYYYPTARPDVALVSPNAAPILGDTMCYTVSPLVVHTLLPGLYKAIFTPAPVTRRFRRRFPHDLVLRPGHLHAAASDSMYLIPTAARLRRHYSRLRIPTAIVTGSGDRIVHKEPHALRLAGDLPDARLTIVSGAGHMVHHVAPAAVARAIEEIAAAAGMRR
ncbi:alpha/beta fold hydrolase [Microvirga massiliensis]|uniref:alpha/beta fold hydrolase n=1 Tax=Microvirga massiliensis TaxID=1033741 RepID=UPI00062BD39B|nr:alpha/beta hydrolase [Microvirga massiliensis]